MNVAEDDGLSRLCKKCISKRNGIDNTLNIEDEVFLLKYLPYANKKSKILCERTDKDNAEDARPLSMADIARREGISFSELQSRFYKYTRLGLVMMIHRGNEDNQIDILIGYRVDNIKKFFFEDKKEAE